MFRPTPPVGRRQHTRLGLISRSKGSFSTRRILLVVLASAILLAPLLLLGRSSSWTGQVQQSASRKLSEEDGEETKPVPAFTVLESPYKPTDWPTARGEAQPIKVGQLLGALEGMQSAYNCTVAESGYEHDYVVCRYEYLAVWNGSVYFFHPDPSIVIPDVNVEWMLGGTFDEFVRYERQVSDLRVPPETDVIVHNQAALMFLSFSHNFYHVFAEYMPSLHAVLCQHLDLCAYDSASQLQILMLNPDMGVHQIPNPMSADLTKCISSLPPRHLRAPQHEGKLLLLRHAIVGWGSEVRADYQHIHHWESRRPPPLPIMDLWRRRLSSCLRFDAAKSAATATASSGGRVNVGIVARELIANDYFSGRAFLNEEEVVGLVRSRWPQADVQVHHLDGLGIDASAQLFNNISVLIWQHGAAMANLIFLPHGATGIQVLMKDRPQELYGWPDALNRDLPNGVSLVHTTNVDPDNIIMRAGYTRWCPEWGSVMTPEFKLAVWERKQCPGREGDHLNHVCEEFWFKIGSSLQVDLEQLAHALDMVMPGYVAGGAPALLATSGGGSSDMSRRSLNSSRAAPA